MRHLLVRATLLLSSIAGIVFLTTDWRTGEKIKTQRELTCKEHISKLAYEGYPFSLTNPSVIALRRQWKTSVPILIEALTKKHSVRRQLYRIVYTNLPVVVADKMLLLDADANELAMNRNVAIEVLGMIGPEAKAAVPALIRCLTEGTDYSILSALLSEGTKVI